MIIALKAKCCPFVLKQHKGPFCIFFPLRWSIGFQDLLLSSLLLSQRLIFSSIISCLRQNGGWRRGSWYGYLHSSVGPRFGAFIPQMNCPRVYNTCLSERGLCRSLDSALLVEEENKNMTKESNASSCGQATFSCFIYKLFSSSRVIQTNNVEKNGQLWVNNV